MTTKYQTNPFPMLPPALQDSVRTRGTRVKRGHMEALQPRTDMTGVEHIFNSRCDNDICPESFFSAESVKRRGNKKLNKMYHEL